MEQRILKLIKELFRIQGQQRGQDWLAKTNPSSSSRRGCHWVISLLACARFHGARGLEQVWAENLPLGARWIRWVDWGRLRVCDVAAWSLGWQAGRLAGHAHGTATTDRGGINFAWVGTGHWADRGRGR